MNAYYEQELERAIRTLGKHWVLHPDNRVRKLKEPMPDKFRWQPTVLKTKPRGKK